MLKHSNVLRIYQLCPNYYKHYSKFWKLNSLLFAAKTFLYYFLIAVYLILLYLIDTYTYFFQLQQFCYFKIKNKNIVAIVNILGCSHYTTDTNPHGLVSVVVVSQSLSGDAAAFHRY